MEHRKIFAVVLGSGESVLPSNGILLETGSPNYILLEDDTYILLE